MFIPNVQGDHESPFHNLHPPPPLNFLTENAPRNKPSIPNASIFPLLRSNTYWGPNWGMWVGEFRLNIPLILCRRIPGCLAAWHKRLNKIWIKCSWEGWSPEPGQSFSGSIYRKRRCTDLLGTFPSTFNLLYASLMWQGLIGPVSFLSLITIRAAKHTTAYWG